VEPVHVHVDAAGERDEPLAPPDNEKLLVMALGRAGVILLRVTVGKAVQRPDRLAVQVDAARRWLDRQAGPPALRRVRWWSSLPQSACGIPRRHTPA